MNTTRASYLTRFKVGLFTLTGVLLVGGITVFVNDQPFWWRSCQLVKINVEDATGLKTKSPVRSLGIEIGYLKSVDLTETHVVLGICVTAPVEVLPETRAYLRGEGFLGDKFVELKPVKYLGTSTLEIRKDKNDKNGGGTPPPSSTPSPSSTHQPSHSKLWDWVIPNAAAAATDVAASPAKKGKAAGREVPVGEETQDVQHLVNRVDELVQQMSGLTDNLKQAINPEELRRTMNQLNQTLSNASRTLSPEGGLNQTARRTLAKLEDAIEQFRDVATRVNQGEGSVGRLLNDPVYADEIHKIIQNVNRLLNKMEKVRLQVDMGGAYLPSYSGGRAWFNLGIWPRQDRYYLFGLNADPRGRISNQTVTTTTGGVSIVTRTLIEDQTSFLFTAMMGKIFFERVDIAIGLLYGDGAASASLYLGPTGAEDRIQIRNDIYVRNAASSVNDRLSLIVTPVDNLYVRVGAESLFGSGRKGLDLFVSAGISFNDEELKLLFALK